MKEILNVILSPSGCYAGSRASLRLQYLNVGYVHSTSDFCSRSWQKIDKRIRDGEGLTPQLSAAIEVHILYHGEPPALRINRRASLENRIRAVYAAYVAVVNAESSRGE